MADPVYLSLWVPDFSSANMLGYWAKALGLFPASSLAPGIRELAVYPFNWAEAPVLEQSLEEGAPMGEAVRLAAEFLHQDYAYQAEINWDVWVPQSNEDEAAGPDGRPQDGLAQWERVPGTVSIACLGPEFEPESDHGEERAHLLLNLGLDTLFLPDLSGILGADADTEDEDELAQAVAEALEGVAGDCYRENIAQLLGYIRKLEKSLPIDRRLLWSS